jgi:hypothetical protein
VSFDSEPGRDDGSLPPVDVVIPDDARELARDVLAYHRELRARRRHARMRWLIGPFGRVRHAAIFPLVASCVALALLAGTMLSVVTISPASAPTTQPTVAAPTTLPLGNVELANGPVIATTALEASVLALIPLNCDCGPTLQSLAKQAKTAGVGVYFVYDAESSSFDPAQATALTHAYGYGVAQAMLDSGGTLFWAYEPRGLTALLVNGGGTVHVVRTFLPGFDLTPALRRLRDTH